jgi:hypothetical protein
MGIEFQEENFNNQQFSQNIDQKSGSVMVDFLIRKGVVKDAATANIFLVVVALIFIVISIYLFVYGFELPGASSVPPVQVDPVLQQESLEN